jgi:hypothetical protein
VRARAHVNLQWRGLVARADALEPVAKPRHPGHGGGELLRIDPLGQLGENRRHLVQPAGLMLVADQTDDVYLDYTDDGYYVYDRMNSGMGIAVTISF